MKYRKLGDSGLLVSSLCLGTMIFGEESGRGCSPDASKTLIAKFVEAGGNFIDTADAYAKFRSEEITGEAIRSIRTQIILSSKVGLPVGEGVNDAGLGRQHVISGVEASLKRLRTDYLDILYFHTHDPLTPILESLEAADTLIRAGKVRYLGVCNQFAWKLTQACMMARASGLPRVICAQYQYNPVCRGIENEHIDLFEAFGISLIPWSPLAGGLLSGKYKEGSGDFRFDAAPSLEDSRESRLTGANLRVLETITAIANSRENTAAQIALAWLLKKRSVGSIAIGARTPQQLDDNLGALSINLTAEDMSAIDRAGAPAPAYPYDFMRKARPGARSAFVQGQASAL